MVKIILLSLFVIQLSTLAYSQEATGAAPKVSTFFTEADLLGNSSNSVNLFTGDVSFKLPIVSISSSTGLEASVSLNYNSSGIQSKVNTWNLDAPTSCVGLGWNLQYSKIVSNYKETGTIIDDEYYLFDGSSTVELIRISSGTDALGSFFTYKIKTNPYWQIKFYSELSSTNKNRWEIITDDGTKFIYGANDSRKAIQYLVRWDNWIGNSSMTSGQSRMAIAWNLTEVENLFGQKLIYEYFNQENRVGQSGQLQTEASYLKSILNPEGIKIELFYSTKSTNWYTEPHTEAIEPDAYQEFYEKHFLDFIEVRTELGTLLRKVDLTYSNLGMSSAVNKMILSSVQDFASNGNYLKPMIFEYHTSENNNLYNGFLWKITSPLGGTAVYNYSVNDIDNSSRQITVTAPLGYSEAKTWIGNDYILVAWRNTQLGHIIEPSPVKLFLYQWVGFWKSIDVGTITNVSLTTSDVEKKDYLNFSVITEEKYIAIRHIDNNKLSKLIILTKDVFRNNDIQSWTIEEHETQLSPDCDPYYSVISGGEKFFISGFYKGSPAERFTFNGKEWVKESLSLFTGHYLFRAGHNYFIAHDEFLDKFYFNFLNDFNIWEQREWGTNQIFYSSGISFWSSSASMLVVMAKNNPEFAYRWSRDFNNFYKDTKADDNTDLFGLRIDEKPVYILNNSTVGVIGRMARFNGVNWKAIDYDYYSDGDDSYYFFGEDYLLRSTDSNNWRRREYNPNTNTFSADGVLIQGVFKKTAIGTSSDCFNKKIYFKSTNGIWQNIGTANQAIFGNVLNAGYNSYVLFGSSPKYHESTAYVKNGTLVNVPGLGEVVHYDNKKFVSRGVSNNFLITYPRIVNNATVEYEDTKKLTLTRMNYGRSDQIGNITKQSDFVVNSVIVYDGQNSNITKFRYNQSLAKMDPEGLTAHYDDVDVIRNADYLGEPRKGYTKYKFFNQNHSQGKILQGQNYQVQMYNQENNLVNQSETNFEISYHEFLDTNGKFLDNGYEIRTSEVRQSLDGITKEKKILYSSQNGKPVETSEYLITYENQTQVKNKIRTYKQRYAHEFYPTLIQKNILSWNIFSELYEEGKGLLSSEVKTLKFWGLSQAPTIHRIFTWDGYESSDFSAWSESINPPIQWRLKSRLDDVDIGSGLAKETTDASGIKTVTLWDMGKKLPIAIVTNSLQNQFLYFSFENDVSNFSNTAYSGSKSSSSALNIVLPSVGTYTLSWWQKQGQNNWQYMEQNISSNFSIGGSGLLIDEVRLLPQNADMITNAYDERGNVISRCDANSNCIHYEYDEFNRVKIVRDEKKNIIENKVYQLD